MVHDPFPRDRVTTLMRRVPAYIRLAWHLAREPLLSKARRAAVVGAAGYLISPVDLVPGVIPVLGQLDDIAVAIAAIRFALAGLSPEQRQRHLAAVGLEDAILLEDVRTLAVATAWTAGAGVRTTGRAARRTGAATVAGAKATARVTRSAVDAAAPAARGAAARLGPAARGAATRAAPAMRKVAAAPASGARIVVTRIPVRHRTPTADDVLPVEQEAPDGLPAD
jgi:uncharacterized membrane protein YkvA (DUF1232 family)